MDTIIGLTPTAFKVPRLDAYEQTAVGTKSTLVKGFVVDAGRTSFNLGACFLISGNYNDTLSGGGKVNATGFQSSFTVSGDTSFEMFRGAGGDDTIDGKTGHERADYRQGNPMPERIHALLAAGTVTGDPLAIGTDTLRGIESICGRFLDDICDARGFTLSNATTKSVNNGDSIAFVPSCELLASTAPNEFLAAAGNDNVIGNGATRVSFDRIFIANLTALRWPRPSPAPAAARPTTYPGSAARSARRPTPRRSTPSWGSTVPCNWRTASSPRWWARPC